MLEYLIAIVPQILLAIFLWFFANRLRLKFKLKHLAKFIAIWLIVQLWVWAYYWLGVLAANPEISVARVAGPALEEYISVILVIAISIFMFEVLLWLNAWRSLPEDT